jgi:hypothetical protein
MTLLAVDEHEMLADLADWNAPPADTEARAWPSTVMDTTAHGWRISPVTGWPSSTNRRSAYRS